MERMWRATKAHAGPSDGTGPEHSPRIEQNDWKAPSFHDDQVFQALVPPVGEDSSRQQLSLKAERPATDDPLGIGRADSWKMLQVRLGGTVSQQFSKRYGCTICFRTA
jgi:hypothetical protein